MPFYAVLRYLFPSRVSMHVITVYWYLAFVMHALLISCDQNDRLDTLLVPSECTKAIRLKKYTMREHVPELDFFRYVKASVTLDGTRQRGLSALKSSSMFSFSRTCSLRSPDVSLLIKRVRARSRFSSSSLSTSLLITRPSFRSSASIESRPSPPS